MCAKDELKVVYRGEVYMAELSGEGHIQGGYRPVVIVGNDIGNRYSPNVVVVPLTAKSKRSDMETHIPVAAGEGGLLHNSYALCEGINTIDKNRLSRRIGALSEAAMSDISAGVKSALCL